MPDKKVPHAYIDFHLKGISIYEMQIDRQKEENYISPL
jgi:hypothetical protein